MRSTRSKRAPRTTIIPATSSSQLRNPKRLTIDLNGEALSYDYVFLRDSCQCRHCVNPVSREKLFQTSDISPDVRPLFIMTLPNGALRITWDPQSDVPWHNPLKGTNHTSLYTTEFLRRYSQGRHIVRGRFDDRPQVLWDKVLMEDQVLWMDYGGYLESDEKLFEALNQLCAYGLFFLRGVPAEESSVEKVAERIGAIKDTLYGRTWDIKSHTDPKNVPYTSLDLGLHMDLLYFESPPGVQFLHCLKNTAQGGSSIFADAFRAATTVRMSSHMLWHSLLRYPVPFRYEYDGHHYHHAHPTVVLDRTDYRTNKRISHVNYSPPSQAPFEGDGQSLDDLQYAGKFKQFHTALRMFANGINEPKAQFELTLAEGDCAVFVNRRVLHGRRRFDSRGGGERWLKGAYVDTDAFLSKWRVLSGKFKGTKFSRPESYEYVRTA